MPREWTYNGVRCIQTDDTRNHIPLWRLDGRIIKRADSKPFLVSLAKCRRYILEYDEMVRIGLIKPGDQIHA